MATRKPVPCGTAQQSLPVRRPCCAVFANQFWLACHLIYETCLRKAAAEAWSLGGYQSWSCLVLERGCTVLWHKKACCWDATNRAWFEGSWCCSWFQSALSLAECIRRPLVLRVVPSAWFDRAQLLMPISTPA